MVLRWQRSWCVAIVRQTMVWSPKALFQTFGFAKCARQKTETNPQKGKSIDKRVEGFFFFDEANPTRLVQAEQICGEPG